MGYISYVIFYSIILYPFALGVELLIYGIIKLIYTLFFKKV